MTKKTTKNTKDFLLYLEAERDKAIEKLLTLNLEIIKEQKQIQNEKQNTKWGWKMKLTKELNTEILLFLIKYPEHIKDLSNVCNLIFKEELKWWLH